MQSLGLLEEGGFERALSNRSGPHGRTQTSIVALSGSRARLHLRPIRPGGLLAGLRGEGIWGLARPIAELRATAELAVAGAPVPIPVLVMARRKGRLWNAAVGTIFEEETRDAAAFIASARDHAQMVRAAAAAGRAIKRFHDCGGSHRDLHLGNLLVRERAGKSEVVIVDLDRAVAAQAVSPRRRMRELMRLYRSLIKRGCIGTAGPQAQVAFFSAYTAGDRRLRAALLSHLPREKIRVSIHALGYRDRA